MKTVYITGWQPGLKKISLSELFRKCVGLSLSESKLYVDNLLDGQQLTINLADHQVSMLFIEECTAIGAICHIE